MDPEERANELADTFRAKAKLPPPVTNAYTALPEHPAVTAQTCFLRIRNRTVLKILRDLDEHSGTGPDFLPARILKRCATELALPVNVLAKKLLDESRWPECWRSHWIHALFKRKSRADANKQRRPSHCTTVKSRRAGNRYSLDTME